MTAGKCGGMVYLRTVCVCVILNTPHNLLPAGFTYVPSRRNACGET